MVLIFIPSAYAADKSRIELTDGSAVEGEIVSFSGGQYTVRSAGLGDLKIEDSKVRNIRKIGETAGSSSAGGIPLDPAAIRNEVQKLQSKITGDPDTMKAVAGLVSKTDFQDLLKDPEIMNAAKSLDIKTLMANEKFVNAVNDPAIKKIGQKVKAEDS